MQRRMAHCGTYYPCDPYVLRTLVGGLLDVHKVPVSYPEASVVAVTPHGPYSVAGSIYALAYRRLAMDADTVVILSPDHYAKSSGVVIDAHDYWETPLGYVKVDAEMARRLAEETGIPLTEKPFMHEHAIEVQLPWIRLAGGEAVWILPIIVPGGSARDAFRLIDALLTVADKMDRAITILATSDMSHYKSPDEAFEQDLKAVMYVSKLDHYGLLKYASESTLSWCGVDAVAAAVYAAKKMRYTGAELVGYSMRKIGRVYNTYGGFVFV